MIITLRLKADVILKLLFMLGLHNYSIRYLFGYIANGKCISAGLFLNDYMNAQLFYAEAKI